MRKGLSIAIVCCAIVFALGLVACGGSSSGGSGGSGGGTAPQKNEILPEYIDEDGGVTLNAFFGLTGPEMADLLKQQGYEWASLVWENEETGDTVYLRSADDNKIDEKTIASVTGKGELAEGYIKLRTSARSIEWTPDDLITVRDAMLQGFTVDDSWLTGGGAYLYSVMSNEAGERAILIVIAYDAHTAEVEFETDAYLTANGDGGVDGIIELWKS